MLCDYESILCKGGGVSHQFAYAMLKLLFLAWQYLHPCCVIMKQYLGEGGIVYDINCQCHAVTFVPCLAVFAPMLCYKPLQCIGGGVVWH